MTNIKKIPDDKLKRDLHDSYQDIEICTKALTIGITKYSGGSVQERLDGNNQFVQVITAEIGRRKKESTCFCS